MAKSHPVHRQAEYGSDASRNSDPFRSLSKGDDLEGNPTKFDFEMAEKENPFAFVTDSPKNGKIEQYYGKIEQGEVSTTPSTLPASNFREIDPISVSMTRNHFGASYPISQPQKRPLNNFNRQPFQRPAYIRPSYQRPYVPRQSYRPVYRNDQLPQYYQRPQSYYRPPNYNSNGQTIQTDTSDLVYLTANGAVPVNPALGPIILYGQAGSSAGYGGFPQSGTYGNYGNYGNSGQQSLYNGYNGSPSQSSYGPYSQGSPTAYGSTYGNGPYTQQSYGQWSPYGTSYKIGGGPFSYLGK